MLVIDRRGAIDVARRRLASQRLTTPGFATAAEAVRTLGAVQAQDYAGAKWALGLRTVGLCDADIEREMTEGRILRTHVLRPTWHFVAPADIRWMLALTAPRVTAAMAYYNRTLELTPAVFRRSNDAIAKALAGGTQLTRTELGTVLRRARVGVASGQRLGHLMMQAELDAVVCSGGRRGKQFTYALLDDRAPRTAALDRDQALLELTRRYFATRGPASARDFAWWSGLAMADVKRGLELAKLDLEQTTIGDQTVWFASSRTAAPAADGSAHLLPNYDEYFIGFKDRGAIAQRLGAARIREAGSDVFAYLAFVDGQIVGAWKRTLQPGRVVVEVALLTRLAAAEKRAIQAQARRFGDFLGVNVETQLSHSR